MAAEEMVEEGEMVRGGEDGGGGDGRGGGGMEAGGMVEEGEGMAVMVEEKVEVGLVQIVCNL